MDPVGIVLIILWLLACGYSIRLVCLVEREWVVEDGTFAGGE